MTLHKIVQSTQDREYYLYLVTFIMKSVTKNYLNYFEFNES